MTPERIRKMLERVSRGEVGVENALGQLARLPFEDLGFARVDHHRALRQGFPEVIFCQGKTPDQVVAISQKIVDTGASLLATRASAETASAVLSALPDAQHNEVARTVVVPGDSADGVEVSGNVLVVSAGTSDLPVAEEACVTIEVMGSPAERLYDVGVAGIHRLLAHREMIENASAIVVAAGMEGALASVVGGLVDVPVIAVPTSTGYGASFGGVAALLGMLNSCAPGVTVVNIDNGFGAGYTAALINRARRER